MAGDALMDLEMRVHAFMSPNGNGFCGFEEFGVTCGHGPNAPMHLAATPNPVDQPHSFVPDASGMVPGCQKESGGKWCNRTEPSWHHQGWKEHVGKKPKTSADPVGDYLAEKAGWAHETYHGAQFPVDSPPTTAQVVAMFHDHALRLAVAKDQKYAQAWIRQGWQGNVARVLSKAARVEAMLWKDQPDTGEGSEETLRDTLLDLANLCAFAAHNIAEGNRWGDGRGN